MNFDIKKESSIEYCENIYALSTTYLKNDNNIELKHLLKEIIMLEDKIRECSNEGDIDNYISLLKIVCNRIEGIINA